MIHTNWNHVLYVSVTESLGIEAAPQVLLEGGPSVQHCRR